MKNADEPINPALIQNPSPQNETSLRLTKIEYFSGLALQGLLSNPQYWKRVYKDVSTLKSDKDSIECIFAYHSIKIAEELLEQLEKKIIYSFLIYTYLFKKN